MIKKENVFIVLIFMINILVLIVFYCYINSILKKSCKILMYIVFRIIFFVILRSNLSGKNKR